MKKLTVIALILTLLATMIAPTLAETAEAAETKALRIIGSSQYSMVDVRDYLDFLCAHKELHKTVLSLGTYYKVEDVNTAFSDALAGKNVKTLLVR